jgi:3-keto-5-aminohexanoate cleavage enzyme
VFATTDKVIVEVALNEQCTRDTNPNVPLTAEECAADAIAVADAGAAVVHFHTRDPETGRDLLRTDLYAQAIRLIKEVHPELLVRVPYHHGATGAERFVHIEELAEDPTVQLRAAMIDPGTVTFSAFHGDTGTIVGDHTFTVSNEHFRYFLELCHRRQLQCGLVVREPGHVRLVVAAHRAGWTSGTLLLQIHLSDDALWGVPPSRNAYDVYTGLVPEDIPYTFMSYTNGPSHWPMTRIALEQGAHVRVGIGDTALDADGGAPTNVELVERVVALAAEIGRQPATPHEALRLLGP